jgi:hypothetical protein
MSTTKISDIIIPEVFNPYVIQESVRIDALVNCGIISTNPELDRLASAGGILINMPYFNELTGDDEILDDKTPLTPDKITTGQDIARLHMRGKSWGVNDLAKALSGADPMAAIASQVAHFWAGKRQQVLFSSLKGIFSSASMASNILDIGGTSGSTGMLNADTFIDAKQKLGDAAGKLTAIAMHSVTYSQLQKQNLIETIVDSESNIKIPYYMERRVIVDDSCPIELINGVNIYSTYLFGEGAFGLGNGAAPVPTETDRNSLLGEDILVNRQHFVLHPRGVKWTNSNVVKASPTNEEVALAANWERVYDPKNIRIVQIKHHN